MTNRLPDVLGDLNTWGDVLNNYLNSHIGYSPTDYGAVGDGTTDDLAAIDATIAACPTGGTVILDPTLTYAISDEVTIDKKIVFLLAGATVKKINTASSNYAAFRITVGGTVFDGGWGTIDGQRTTQPARQSGGGIRCDATSSVPVIIRNLYVKSCGGSAVAQFTQSGQTVDYYNVTSTDNLDGANVQNASGFIVTQGTARYHSCVAAENDGYGFTFNSASTDHYADNLRSNRNTIGAFAALQGRGKITSLCGYDNRLTSIITGFGWEIGFIELSWTGTAVGGTYVDGSLFSGSGSGLTLDKAPRTQVGTLIARGNTGYVLAVSYSPDCEFGSIVADGFGSSDIDPVVSVSLFSHRFKLGSGVIENCSFGIIIGETLAAADDVQIGPVQFSNCAFSTLRVQRGDRGTFGPFSAKDCTTTGGLDTAVSYTVAASSDLFTSTSHGYVNNDVLLFAAPTSGAAPIVLDSFYYVIGSASSTFQVSATRAGSALAITSDGSGSVQRVNGNSGLISIAGDDNTVSYVDQRTIVRNTGNATTATSASLTDTTQVVQSGTSTGGNGATTLNDTGKTWVTNEHRGLSVTMTSGVCSGQTRVITTNTATALTVTQAFTGGPPGTDAYTISPLTSGTATSATALTLTDSSKSWVVNTLVGRQITTTGGTGSGQTATVVSNTANTVTIRPPTGWAVVPDATTTYTIGWEFYGAFTITATSGTGSGQVRTISTAVISTATTVSLTQNWAVTPDATTAYKIERLPSWVVLFGVDASGNTVVDGYGRNYRYGQVLDQNGGNFVSPTKAASGAMRT